MQWFDCGWHAAIIMRCSFWDTPWRPDQKSSLLEFLCIFLTYVTSPTMCSVALTNRMTRCSDRYVNMAQNPHQAFFLSRLPGNLLAHTGSATMIGQSPIWHIVSLPTKTKNLCQRDCLIWHGNCHDRPEYIIVWSGHYSFIVMQAELCSATITFPSHIHLHTQLFVFHYVALIPLFLSHHYLPSRPPNRFILLFLL